MEMVLKAISRISAIILIAIIAIAVAASYIAITFFLQPKPGGQANIKLTVITRHPTELTNLARSAFLNSSYAKQYGIADIEFLNPDPGQWRELINKQPIDVAWGGGPTLFDALYQDGYLAPLSSRIVLDAASQIPDAIGNTPLKRIGSDGKIYWVAQAISSFGIIVNKKLLRDYNISPPTTWRDLASLDFGSALIKFGGPAIVIADPTRSTSHLRIYEIVLSAYGWEEGLAVLAALAANSKIIDSASAARDSVIRGEAAATIAVDYYGYIAMTQCSECQYILPPGQSIVNGDPIALLKSSKNPEAAQAFIAWALTEGEKILLNKNINRLPSNPNVFNTPEGAARQDLKVIYDQTVKGGGLQFNDTEVGLYEYAFSKYFKAVFVDAQQYLVSAWKLVVDKYLKGEITADQALQYARRIGAPIEFQDPLTGRNVSFTKEYAISISPKMKSDQNLDSQLTSLWRQKAIERYQAIAKELGG